MVEKHNHGEKNAPATGLGPLLAGQGALVDWLFAEARATSWELTRERFCAALERSAQKRFAETPPTYTQLEEYLRSLHLTDLALACACSEGKEQAWDQFVSIYRGYLRAAAASILRCRAGAPEACDLADSLFAELYGLADGKRGERSLFRYFHGRSSLKTWLRAVLAQRHIDGIRAGRKLDSLEDGEKEPAALGRQGQKFEIADPHRQRYMKLFSDALAAALDSLPPKDRQRLEAYYAQEKTLAEIGRILGEHESSVSRNLERIRGELRVAVEAVLRAGRTAANGAAPEAGLSDAEIALCFEYASADAPIDLDKLFPQKRNPGSTAGRQEP